MLMKKAIIAVAVLATTLLALASVQAATEPPSRDLGAATGGRLYRVGEAKGLSASIAAVSTCGFMARQAVAA
jgi:hypothetical protein